MSYAPKKVVIDTSSLIAACIYPDRFPASIYKQALLRCQLVASQETKAEIQSVLSRKKFDAWRPLAVRMAWINTYFENIELYSPIERFTNCSDPKDNMFLDVAVVAGASVIVCSDDDLLRLHPFQAHGQQIDILTLRDFQKIYLFEA